VYTYRIQGAHYHKIGSLLPAPGSTPKFSQLYIYDTNFNNELNSRQQVFPHLDPEMLFELQQELHLHNPFAQAFRAAGESARSNENVRLFIHADHGKDIRRYNMPTVSEVAAIMINNDDHTHGRDIILHSLDGSLQRISEIHGAYDPLQYPLLFPLGEHGWHPNIPYRDIEQGNTSKTFFLFYLNGFCDLNKGLFFITKEFSMNP
jgi:hypothetical protein